MKGDFYGNTTLEKVIMYEGITEIEEAAFYGCEKLESITLPASLTSLGGDPRYGIEAKTFKKCTNLKEVIFKGTNLSRIPTGAFYATALESIEIPQNVISIDSEAFSGCRNLTSVTLHEGLKTLEYNAFSDCNLTTIVLPESLTFLGKEVFTNSGKSTLREIHLKNPRPLVGKDEINASAFGETYKEFVKSVTFYVPVGSLSAYKQADVWKNIQHFRTELYVANVRVSSLLPELIGNNKNEITDLKLTGEIDGMDILFLREMSGRDKAGNETEGNLLFLDMSDVRIVEGGGRYYDKSGQIGESSNDSIGDYAFYQCQIDSLILPANIYGIGKSALAQLNISQILIPEKMKRIGEYTFEGCKLLKSIDIPSGIEVIPKGAFQYCNSLELISLPTTLKEIGDYAFSGWNTSIEKIEIPNSVRSIGKYAFSNLKNLSQVKLPENITCIENGMFNNCTALSEISLPAGIVQIKDEAFKDCSSLNTIRIPALVEDIGSEVFANCKTLKDFEFPQKLKSIGNSAFKNCDALQVVSLPDELLTINAYAFNECDLLQDIIIPARVSYIGNAAFSFCKALKSIIVNPSNEFYTSTDGVLFNKSRSVLFNFPTTKGGDYHIPEEVEYISDYAFYNCANLMSVVIPDGVKVIRVDAFAGCQNIASIRIPSSVTQLESNVFYNCSSLVKAYLPDNITSMGSGVFQKCTLLKTVNIPASLKSLPDFTFSGCHILREIELPKGITSIGSSAFNNCKLLSSITIPGGVTTIGSGAFTGCAQLEKISNENPVPQAIDTYVFSGVDYTSCKLAIPFGSLSAYQMATGWKEFLNIKEEIITGTSIAISSDNNQFLKIENNKIKGSVAIPVTLSIYSINGQLIKSCIVSGDFMIPLERGLYIIKLGTESRKINIL